MKKKEEKKKKPVTPPPFYMHQLVTYHQESYGGEGRKAKKVR